VLVRLSEFAGLVALWALGALGLLLAAIVLLFRFHLWAIVLVLVLAIASGNLPLGFLMVLVLGSVLAGLVRV
jgi:hypothetical protein